MPVYYIFYSLLFLVSFAVGQGVLNENVYAKHFAFGVTLLAMMAMAFIQTMIHKTATTIFVGWGDVFVIFFLGCYMFFYFGTHNDLDLTLPILYFLFYCFMRIQDGNSPTNVTTILIQIVPIIILLHVLVSSLQFFRIIPSFHQYFAVGSTFGNPDMLGAYIAVLSSFCYFRTQQKLFGYIILLFGFGMLLLLQARTAIVATVVTGGVYLYLSGRITPKHFLYGIVSLTAGLAVLILWHPASVCGRLFIWYMSLCMITEKPMGWGLYAFEKHYPEFQADYVVSHPNIPEIFNPDLVHSSYNEFLNIGVSLGLPGLLCFVALIGAILFAAYKSRSLFIYPLCSFLIISLSYFPFKIVPLMVVCIAFAAITIKTGNPSQPLFRIHVRSIGILLIPVWGFVALLSFHTWSSYKSWQKAVKYTQTEQKWNDATFLFNDIYPDLKGNGRFLITQANLQYQIGDTLAALLSMQEAERFFCDNVFLENLALLYERTGHLDKAKEIFVKAINIVPGQFNTGYAYILFLQRNGFQKEAYEQALHLYNKPVRSTYYADPYIIKSKLRKIIQSYQ